MADSQIVCHSGTPPDPNVRFFIYLDESNFRINGDTASKRRFSLPQSNVSWHYDVRVLQGIIRKHSGMSVDEKVNFMVYGSNIEHSLVHQDLELHTWDVTTFSRLEKRKEKKVDTSLVSDMSVQALVSMKAGKSAVFAVISGDSDMRPAVECATRYGHTVHIWSWEESLSDEYRQLKREGLISLTLLDRFLDALTMSSSSILVKDILIPPNSLVFPNPWERSYEVLERIKKELPDGSLTLIKRSNGVQDYCTDIAILPRSGLPIEDAIFRCMLKNLQHRELHVMSFAEYFHSSGQFELRGRLRIWLTFHFPELFCEWLP
ncbi:hypothetical protein FNAPI_11490 [Fusarium napiforme]|uniref:NYN domain-containing protein n=1 Tax=Fusarium napiforme TaxID=42672 RepID=A0A8H5MQ10_9HYPO|nr:hypothetical protein FNAPI_11490 [Fusarium napiforme]